MNSPDAIHIPHHDDDPTSTVQPDAVDSVTATATPDGLSDGKPKGDLENLIERVAQLKASEPVPKVLRRHLS